MGDLYRYMRGELLKRAGVQYEEPGEMAREHWEKLIFPEAVRHYEDVDEVLDRIILSHTRMYKTGNFRENDPDSVRRELQDLRRKVPKGSRLREFFAVKDYEPTSFRQWVELVQQFASTLGRRSGGRGSAEGRSLPERGRRAGEDADPEAGPQGDVDPWSTGEDPWRGGSSQINRLNDFRQTASALRGRGTQARSSGSMPGRAGGGRECAVVWNLPGAAF